MYHQDVTSAIVAPQHGGFSSNSPTIPDDWWRHPKFILACSSNNCRCPSATKNKTQTGLAYGGTYLFLREGTLSEAPAR